uniref:Uncharacterized protein n=1 Tax=Pipistrellus kuhlii TaxID=59472 RepID=A0A7J7VV64_PIPKU|nr:hypothetical protein mPipKuh1_008252 [Pipistrellus kuhlii]
MRNLSGSQRVSSDVRGAGGAWASVGERQPRPSRPGPWPEPGARDPHGRGLGTVRPIDGQGTRTSGALRRVLRHGRARALTQQIPGEERERSPCHFTHRLDAGMYQQPGIQELGNDSPFLLPLLKASTTSSEAWLGSSFRERINHPKRFPQRKGGKTAQKERNGTGS